MPVVGHAFVGIATGLVTRPGGASVWVRALWIPAIVALAYLPDVFDQIVLLLGWGYRPAISHSLVFLVVSSAVLGVPLARTARSTYRRGAGVVFFSVGFHVILDVLQTPRRTVFWPFGRDSVSEVGGILPLGILWEGLLFGVAFGLFLAVREGLRGARNHQSIWRFCGASR